MNKNGVTIGTVVMVAFVGCCGFGNALLSLPSGVPEGAEAPEEQPDGVTQVEGQAAPPEAPEAPPSKPGWLDPEQVAGEEHGTAAGLTFARIFELSQHHHDQVASYPDGVVPAGVDAVADAARRAGVTREIMWDAMQSNSDETRAMRDAMNSGPMAIDRGVVGDVEVTDVRPSELGPLTVFAKLTVIGCPGRTDLAFLAQIATTTMAKNLPASASGYRAAMWSDGLSCSPSSLGTAVFDAASSKLTLR